MNADFFDLLSKDNSLNSKERFTNTYTKNKSFRQAFCLHEIEKEDFLKMCYAKDVLTILPGVAVIGKGLDDRLKQCIISIKKNNDYFVYSNNELPDDEEYQILKDKCIFVFIGKGNDAFVIMQNINGSDNTIYHFEEDVVIGVYLETEFFGRYNGKYLSLIKDTSFDINICAVTADSNVAEFMYNFFIGGNGLI